MLIVVHWFDATTGWFFHRRRRRRRLLGGEQNHGLQRDVVGLMLGSLAVTLDLFLLHATRVAEEALVGNTGEVPLLLWLLGTFKDECVPVGVRATKNVTSKKVLRRRHAA